MHSSRARPQAAFTLATRFKTSKVEATSQTCYGNWLCWIIFVTLPYLSLLVCSGNVTAMLQMQLLCSLHFKGTFFYFLAKWKQRRKHVTATGFVGLFL